MSEHIEYAKEQIRRTNLFRPYEIKELKELALSFKQRPCGHKEAEFNADDLRMEEILNKVILLLE